MTSLKRKSRGFTLMEAVISATILAIITLGFGNLLKYLMRSTTGILNTTFAQESTREGINRLEEALLHANELIITSGTSVTFITDIDQSPNYNPYALSVNSIPNYLDFDRANTASSLPTVGNTQWLGHGDNLQNDDENGDGKIDVMRTIYWSTSTGIVYLDTSLNQDAWGSRVQKLIPNVSSFTITYFGNPAVPPGNQVGVDANADGIITWNEMDCAPANACGVGLCNCNGKLDTRMERKFVMFIRIHVEVQNNGKTVYKLDTDIYPPLLPLKSVRT